MNCDYDNCSPMSVKDEIEGIRINFPKVVIYTATNDFLNASYERTPFTRVKLSLAFPEGYPKNRNLIVTVHSDDIVPPGLKKKLENDLTMVAQSTYETSEGKYEQVNAVIQRLVKFVDNNKFLPCWKERKQCADLITESNKNVMEDTMNQSVKPSAFTFIDNKGKIKLRLVSNLYHYSCTITIDDGYPSTVTHEDWGKACNLQLDSTNFPPKIETLLTSQAKELVRRMQDGMTAQDALQMSNPIRKPKHFKDDSKQAPTLRLTHETLKGLKKDTDTLSRVRDLREVNSAVIQGNARIKANSAKVRKDARRTINKITEQEIKKDTAQEEKEKNWHLQEKARLAGYNISPFDGSNPQPSLLSLVKFLMNKIQRLPDEVCPCCQKLTLPIDPKELKILYISATNCKTEKEKKIRKKARLKRPIRTYCGCWYHYDCLNKLITEPPFGLSCPTPGCGRRVYHPDWPDDIKQLERAWANEQARKREIEDAAMFL